MIRQYIALLSAAGLSLSLSLIVIAQTSSNTHQSTRTAIAKGNDVKKLFKQHCIKCHGADGAGQTAFGEIVGAADFTDAEWQKKVDDQRLVNSMTHGRGQMPSFGKKLSEQQIILLLKYVRAFGK